MGSKICGKNCHLYYYMPSSGTSFLKIFVFSCRKHIQSLENYCCSHNQTYTTDNLRFTSKVSLDLDNYKTKTCQSVILAKEQFATKGDIIHWYLADALKTTNGKAYSSIIAEINIKEYKKWLWNKTRALLANTFYFSDHELKMLEEHLLYSSMTTSIQHEQ